MISTTVMMCLALMATAQVVVFNDDDFKPGKEIDRLKYRIHYDMTFVNDTTKVDSIGQYISAKEPMILEIGSRATSFYSYTKWQSDSLVGEAKKRGESSFQVKGKITWRLYKHYPRRGEYTWLDGISAERYAMREQVEEPRWRLEPDSTCEILGYTCQLAAADYRGRQWKAWYTDEIPLSEGPWKLCGLPGLVLRASDATGQYAFECTGMKQSDGTTPLLYKGEYHEEISKKALGDLYRRYHADPVGYVTNNPNIKVVVKDEHGNNIKMPAMPYNPIEK